MRAIYTPGNFVPEQYVIFVAKLYVAFNFHIQQSLPYCQYRKNKSNSTYKIKENTATKDKHKLM